VPPGHDQQGERALEQEGGRPIQSAGRIWPPPSASKPSRGTAKRVRFYSTVELVNILEQEKACGRAGRLAQQLMHLDLVILDELGYLPFSQSGGALLFHLLSTLYEHTSVIITTNLVSPSGRVFSAIPR
jgi:DNA replication protein DnaC